MKPVVGLIGGIGSGKSLLAQEFGRRGARIIAGDQLGHEALGQPEIRERVVARFGKEIADEHGNIERSKLGAVVFADREARRALEAIVHPRIEERIADEITAAERDQRVKLVVLDAAILLEAGWDRFCDRIVFVHAPRELRLERIARQRGWSATDVETRAQAQLPLAEKVSRADAVVVNAGSPSDLAVQVEELMRLWGLVVVPDFDS